ncbi:hypothetical protein DINM_001463 [Dirofilaria immitis]|nr:hypothetical protein [Dirofilaria immitis]
MVTWLRVKKRPKDVRNDAVDSIPHAIPRIARIPIFPRLKPHVYDHGQKKLCPRFIHNCTPYFGLPLLFLLVAFIPHIIIPLLLLLHIERPRLLETIRQKLPKDTRCSPADFGSPSNQNDVVD